MVEETGRRGFKIWPSTLLGPPPGLKELNVLCWALFVTFFLLPLTVVLIAQHAAGKKFSNFLPVDFIYYYGDGRLVNEYPPEALYNHDLQMKVFNEIYPLHGGESYSVSPYPPLVGQIFGLYARLPIAQAYFLWLATSLSLYMAGIFACLHASFPADRVKRSIVLFFAIMFPPFLYNTLAVGQLSSVAVFSAGLALYFESRSKRFSSGLALSILSYKPILLVLILPMLLLTRRWKTLYGYLSGTTVLIAIATLISGFRIWVAYTGLIGVWFHEAGVHGKAVYKHWLLIDLNSFFYGIPGMRSKAGLLLLGLGIAAIAGWGAILFWKSVRLGLAEQRLVWAVALTWTLLINVYVPIYDSVLVVLALMLTLGVLSELKLPWFTGMVVVLGLSIVGVSTISTTFANRHHVQLITILLVLLGAVEVVLLRRLVYGRAAAQGREMLPAYNCREA
jgi:hypothetical protein